MRSELGSAPRAGGIRTVEPAAGLAAARSTGCRRGGGVDRDLGFAVHVPRVAVSAIALEARGADATRVRLGDRDAHGHHAIVRYDQRIEQHDVAQPPAVYASERDARQEQVEVSGAGEDGDAVDAVLVDDPVVAGVEGAGELDGAIAAHETLGEHGVGDAFAFVDAEPDAAPSSAALPVPATRRSPSSRCGGGHGCRRARRARRWQRRQLVCPLKRSSVLVERSTRGDQRRGDQARRRATAARALGPTTAS
jgi:hypothetical protein